MSWTNSTDVEWPLVVLDSWPVLEWLLGNQPAARTFSEFLTQSIALNATLLIYRMNYGEILFMLAKKLPNARSAPAHAALRLLPLQIVSIDDSYVDQAVAIKSENACSFADCFAASLAIRFDAPVVTVYREFLKLQTKGLLRVEWMGV